MKNIWNFIFITFFLIMISSCKHDPNNNPIDNPSSGGLVSGTVLDAVLGTALNNVYIEITDGNGGDIVSTTTTDDNGEYRVTLATGSQYVFTFTRSGHYTSIYSDVEVRDNEETVLEAILQIDTSVSGVGSVSGQITNAQTGTALSGVLLQFREGINNSTETVIAQATTNTLGIFSLLDTLQTGSYTAEASLSGYTTNYFTVLVLGGQLRGNQNSTMTPTPPPGHIRIVLTWGASPSDLDSHLTGPTSDNSANRFHVYFLNRGSNIRSPFSVLDVDDLTSYGPETVTIINQYQGMYRYSVHDYTNRTSTTSTGLSNSSAKVTVYRENAPPRVFNVPNGTGTLWTVFELNGDRITPVNTLSNHSSSFTIQSTNSQNDGNLIQNLPDK